MSTRISFASGQVQEGPEDWASYHWWEEGMDPEKPGFPVALDFILDVSRIHVDGCLVRLEVSEAFMEKLAADIRVSRWGQK